MAAGAVTARAAAAGSLRDRVTTRYTVPLWSRVLPTHRCCYHANTASRQRRSKSSLLTARSQEDAAFAASVVRSMTGCLHSCTSTATFATAAEFS